VKQVVEKFANYLLSILFFKAPQANLTEEDITSFETIIDFVITKGDGTRIQYNYKQPKYLFLQYFVENYPVLLHGSNNLNISTLEPREQTDYSGVNMTAIFASGDGIWPIFFATLNNRKILGSIRNGCFATKGG
jgi:hypothetical protein